MNSHSSAHADGFTMTEVVVVVAVVAIFAALAAPMLGNHTNTRLASAARLLAADLDRARIATLTQSDRPTVVVFDETGDRYHLAYADDPDEPIEHPTHHGPYKVIIGQGAAASLAGITIQTLDFDDDPTTLAFGRFGELKQPEPARITLTADGRTLTLTIHPTSGAVSIGHID